MSEQGSAPVSQVGLALGAAALTVIIGFFSFYSLLSSIFDLYMVPDAVFFAQLVLPVLVMVGAGVAACVKRRGRYNWIGFAVSFAAIIVLAIIASATDHSTDDCGDSTVCDSD